MFTKRRLIWQVPGLWPMSDAVEQLWRETLGQDGIIECQEWDEKYVNYLLVISRQEPPAHSDETAGLRLQS